MIRGVILCLISLFSSQLLYAEPLHFSFHKIQSGKPGPTLLVIGGIQGDEPGGFTAASMLVTNYTVANGNLWVVPNLNFKSIIKRSRGIHGDMNRKFNVLPQNDPEYAEVQKIKSILMDKQVDIVLNLHDGSGFYKKTYINRMHNPNRWGQSIIIDQESINAGKYGQLNTIASRVQQYINRRLVDKKKYFYVKNTRTREGDAEMEKSLTYFSIKNNRPAFAVEASKSFLTDERTYYHLLAVEGFMKQMGISYQRDFKLTKAEVSEQIGNNLNISLYDDRINLDVEKARRYLNYVPLKKDASLKYKKNNPLIAVIGKNKTLRVRYGNRYVTSLKPQYFDYDYSLDAVNIQADGKSRRINIGGKVNVAESFRVMAEEGYRVNIIGYARQGVANENMILVKREHIKSRFSIDREENLFRVELYKGKKFSGMVLVNFISKDKLQPVSLNNNKPGIKVSSNL